MNYIASILKMEKGMKNDRKDHKLRWDLLPLQEIEDIVEVYTAGAEKYSDNSWQHLKDGYNRYKAALLRHLAECDKGNFTDPDTGCKHLGQVAWNAIAMLYYYNNSPVSIGDMQKSKEIDVTDKFTTKQEDTKIYRTTKGGHIIKAKEWKIYTDNSRSNVEENLLKYEKK